MIRHVVSLNRNFAAQQVVAVRRSHVNAGVG
jgi:hypothetical protein